MMERISSCCGAVILHLREAARCAREGNSESAEEWIVRAIDILQASTAVLPWTPAGTLPTRFARKVAAHIESNLGKRLRVGELARLVGLSSSQFCRLFKRRFGLTAHAYITLRRIKSAQDMMLQTSRPLSEIALCCGMSDQSHFTRVFRRIVGETPTRWLSRADCPAVVRRQHGTLAGQGAVKSQCSPLAAAALQFGGVDAPLVGGN
jgi:AraC family transcriptional regulator